jgi:fatty-acyl-CoA synthase
LDKLPLPETLNQALDRVAHDNCGMTFFDGRGNVAEELTYARLQQEARIAASALLALDVVPGDRIAIVAETTVSFVILFFACQYANLVPVPLPAMVSLGGRLKYEEQIAFQINNSGAVAAFATGGFEELLTEATSTLELQYVGTLEDLLTRSRKSENIELLGRGRSDSTAYVQYTSGSTKVARGVMIQQHAIIANLQQIFQHGLQLTPEDRFFSWLPFYHDMGLIGKVLLPVLAGVPVSYLGTREFAQRPRLWLSLMSQTQATISFGPPFGYELCARRLRESTGSAYDLSHWRVAGVGAEMIRPQALDMFSNALQGSGFKKSSFLPAYGMAEVGVAVSFAPLNEGYRVDEVLSDNCSDERRATEAPAETDMSTKKFVVCGKPLPGTDVEIRNADGQSLNTDRAIGTIWLRAPSAMSGYLNEPEATRLVLQPDGWLNTGDQGYLVNGQIVVTGRVKDLIIINGRNLWPHDLEAIADTQNDVRPGGAMAFSVTDSERVEEVVMLVQCRLRDPDERQRLVRRIEAQVKTELSVDCRVHLVEAESLPRTSSGKPSRSKARELYLRAGTAPLLSRSRRRA